MLSLREFGMSFLVYYLGVGSKVMNKIRNSILLALAMFSSFLWSQGMHYFSIEKMRKDVRENYAQVVEGYQCAAKQLIEINNHKGGEALAASFEAYQKLLETLDKGATQDKIKELTYKNLVLYSEIQKATRKENKDITFSMTCLGFGFHFQGISMDAGNEPL